MSPYTPLGVDYKVCSDQKADSNILRVDRLQYGEKQCYSTLHVAVCFSFNGRKEGVPLLRRKPRTPADIPV